MDMDRSEQCVCGWVAHCIPAGSFRCDRLVRSSLASSMAGFISGGRLGSLPVWMATSVVSTVLLCASSVRVLLQSTYRSAPLHLLLQQSRRCAPSLPCLLAAAAAAAAALTHLAVLQLEDQLDLVAVDLLLRDLRGHPALGRVGLPCPRPNVVDVRHAGCVWWSALLSCAARAMPISGSRALAPFQTKNVCCGGGGQLASSSSDSSSYS